MEQAPERSLMAGIRILDAAAPIIQPYVAPAKEPSSAISEKEILIRERNPSFSALRRDDETEITASTTRNYSMSLMVCGVRFKSEEHKVED